MYRQVLIFTFLVACADGAEQPSRPSDPPPPAPPAPDRALTRDQSQRVDQGRERDRQREGDQVVAPLRDQGKRDARVDARAGEVDQDGDGHPQSLDCDDGDPGRYPGAPERCNGIDEDCDGSLDEGELIGELPTWFPDRDDDGHGDRDAPFVGCTAPPMHIAQGGDCDDGDPAVNPAQAERCDNVDNNCDGAIDGGIISDGAGCQDPGPLPRGILASSALLTIRNGNNAGDDGSLEFELRGGGERYQRALNNVAWDDHMRNTVDVYQVPLREANLLNASLAGGQGRIHYDDSDAWAISCVQLNLNGVTVYCEDYRSEITLSSRGDEVHVFTLPAPLPERSLPCTCYDRYLSHGPIIGATGADRVRIWGRSDATRQVQLRVGLSPDTLAPVAYRYPIPEEDHTFLFDIFGLSASTTYHYSIDIEGESTAGTFTTAPAVGQGGRYRFAVGSCAKTVPSRHPEQRTFSAIAAREPDMMLMLGDNVYFDSLNNGDAPDVGAMRSYYRDAIQRQASWAAPHYPPRDVYDPENPALRPSTGSRARWWGSFGRDARADLMAAVPTLAIWDDHDFYSNNADAFYDDNRGRKPWTLDSIRIFRQYWPNPPSVLSDEDPNRMGIYFHQSWGDVELFGLDTRFQRDDSREQMLGRAQLDWLKAALSASNATFKFILSGSIFGGSASDDEKWPHFEAELNELYRHIWRNEIGGVVLMSGDVHVSAILAHRNPDNPQDPYVIYEVISSGLANYGPVSPSDYGSIIQMRYFPPFSYDRRRTNTFALVEVESDTDDPRLSVQFFDERGDSACADCPFELRRSALGPR
ncbi:MAG: alkaline phosphatase D family protein [Myxococcota bacterium]|nr:alkaline phosphatase D family protein [Myxococcota bacterium]